MPAEGDAHDGHVLLLHGEAEGDAHVGLLSGSAAGASSTGPPVAADQGAAPDYTHSPHQCLYHN
jgi:hypothetical protein